jgi:hypothetical protein
MFKNIDYKVFKHSNYNLVFTLIVETLDKKKIISKDIEIELTKVIYNIFENHNKCVISKIVFEEESILIINCQSPNIFCFNSRRCCASSDKVAVGRASKRPTPMGSPVSSQ